jgi:hypothetical protein
MTDDRPRRGLFRWLREIFLGEARTTIGTTAPITVSERRDSPRPLVVPAEGGVFTFLVDYELTFTARGLSQRTLAERAESYLASAERSLLNTIWPVGRNHLPQRPDLAEAGMNEVLRTSWCYEENDLPVVLCSARVYVRASPEVIDRQTPLWHRLVELDAHHRVELQRLSVVDDLLTRWVQLVERFGSGPAVVNAAHMVDTDVAKVLYGLAQDRLSTAQELAQVLQKARESHQFVGLYEFANAYDKALRSFELQAGLEPGSVVPNGVGDVQ